MTTRSEFLTIIVLCSFVVTSPVAAKEININKIKQPKAAPIDDRPSTESKKSKKDASPAEDQDLFQDTYGQGKVSDPKSIEAPPIPEGETEQKPVVVDGTDEKLNLPKEQIDALMGDDTLNGVGNSENFRFGAFLSADLVRSGFGVIASKGSTFYSLGLGSNSLNEKSLRGTLTHIELEAALLRNKSSMFFVGLKLGQQIWSADRRIADLRDEIRYKAKLTATYLAPTLGIMWFANPSVQLWSEVGYQIILARKISEEQTIAVVGDRSESDIRASSDFESSRQDVEDSAIAGAGTSKVLVNILTFAFIL